MIRSDRAEEPGALSCEFRAQTGRKLSGYLGEEGKCRPGGPRPVFGQHDLLDAPIRRDVGAEQETPPLEIVQKPGRPRRIYVEQLAEPFGRRWVVEKECTEAVHLVDGQTDAGGDVFVNAAASSGQSEKLDAEGRVRCFHDLGTQVDWTVKPQALIVQEQ